MFFSTAIFASLYASLAAAATTHTVKVGDGGLKFNPASLDAAAGDMVTFVFLAKNHSVSQSSFKDPCTPLKGGFDSGFVATKPNTTADFTNYTIMVTDTKPKWVFCAQASNVTGNHCHKGMVFSINAANGNNTSADAYMQNAMALGVNDPQVVAAAPVNGSSATGPAPTGGASAIDGSGASGGSSASGTGTGTAAPGAAPTDGSSASASGSGSFLFPSGTGSDATNSASATGSDASNSASATGSDAVNNAAASAAADQSSSGSASATSTAAGSAKSSGEKSVARRSMAALAAVGALLVLVL